MRLALVFVLVSAVLLASHTSSSVYAGPITTPALATQLAAGGSVDIILRFSSTLPTLNSAKSLTFATRGARITHVRDQLLSHADKSQSTVVQFLNSKSIESTQFWISNELFIKNADAKLVAELTTNFPEIEAVRENRRHELEKPEPSVSLPRNNILAEWGIENIQADAVWTLPGGGTGEGVVVSTIDTGVRGTHEALRDNYYGTYGWYDPYNRNPAPMDSNGHGTHTMGTICGSGGIGVAPGATWIACRGCDTSSCSDSALLGCAEFIFCPTLPDGSAPNCTHAPDLVSNSWGGGQGDDWYDSSIQAWHSVGIIPVFANGNSGPSCGTANSPADSQAGVIGVGSTTSANALSSFSSKGPAIFGQRVVKPDISAPGSNVRSSYHTADNAYSTLSGTSMACPHVAGVIALLKGINRSEITYQSAKNLIEGHADTNLTPTGQNCGAISDAIYPNHSYGVGKINALRAAQALLSGGKVAA